MNDFCILRIETKRAWVKENKTQNNEKGFPRAKSFFFRLVEQRVFFIPPLLDTPSRQMKLAAPREVPPPPSNHRCRDLGKIQRAKVWEVLLRVSRTHKVRHGTRRSPDPPIVKGVTLRPDECCRTCVIDHLLPAEGRLGAYVPPYNEGTKLQSGEQS